MWGYIDSTSRLRCTRGRPGLVSLVLGSVLSLWIAAGCGSGTIGDGQPNSGQPDSQFDPVDATVPDAVPSPDAPPPPPPDAPPPPSCDELYGAAREYIFCYETETTCAFNARTNGGNCDQMCASLGGTCVAAYDNVSDPGFECDRIVASGDNCTTLRSTEICECTR
jgi:hypothetical protein